MQRLERERKGVIGFGDGVAACISAELGDVTMIKTATMLRKAWCGKYSFREKIRKHKDQSTDAEEPSEA